MSALYLLIQKQPQHKAPLYKYVFCSLSNIMSSWCQYEALKYVSFPTQVNIVFFFFNKIIKIYLTFHYSIKIRIIYNGINKSRIYILGFSKGL